MPGNPSPSPVLPSSGFLMPALCLPHATCFLTLPCASHMPASGSITVLACWWPLHACYLYAPASPVLVENLCLPATPSTCHCPPFLLLSHTCHFFISCSASFYTPAIPNPISYVTPACTCCAGTFARGDTLRAFLPVQHAELRIYSVMSRRNARRASNMLPTGIL